jgi:hypothetical protein
VDQTLGLDVFDIAFDAENPDIVAQMLQLGIHTKLGYDINFIDSRKHQTLSVRLWDSSFNYRAQGKQVDVLLELGADLFRPCMNYPNGVASYPPHYSSIRFIMDYVMSGRQPPWPFLKDETSLAGYLEVTVGYDTNYYEYVLDNLIEPGQFPRLFYSSPTLGQALRRRCFNWMGANRRAALTAILITAKAFTKGGVPLPPSFLGHAIGSFSNSGSGELTTSYLRVMLPVVDRVYSKDAHDAILDESKTLVHLLDTYVTAERDPERQRKNLADLDLVLTLVAFLYDLSSLQSKPECGSLNVLPRFWCKLSGIDLDPEKKLLAELLQGESLDSGDTDSVIS